MQAVKLQGDFLMSLIHLGGDSTVIGGACALGDIYLL